jgi:hypothetical protein
MDTVDLHVTRVALGPGHAGTVTARATGAIGAGDVWMRLADGADRSAEGRRGAAGRPQRWRP